MSSPMIPSPIAYGDIPAGGQFAPMVIAARVPSNTIDKQYSGGYFWLSSRDQYYLNAQNVRVYGDGSLWYQSGNSSGSPNWVIASTAGALVGITGTANQVAASAPVAGVVTLTIPSTFTSPGSVTAANGNLVLSGVGSKLQIHATTAASDSVGTSAALDGDSPSQLVVSTTAVTASSKIFLSYATAGGTQGSLSVGTIVANTSFQIKSSANGDTSTVNYLIIN